MRRSSPWADVRSALARSRRTLRDEGGSASLEFLTVGVLLIVPLVYLVLTLGQIQHAVLGVEGGARHAARVIAQAGTHDEGLAAADRAIRVAMADAGVAHDAVSVSISCEPHADACATRSGSVTVLIATSVPLPMAPTGLELGAGLGVPVSAQAVQPVSAFGGVP
ncbi:TadE/TadG family type IV pilus assembly protein [Agrococcus sp. Ld7]|uniref:TadE/TadG family type IV pilus assembly protein n=1 Tax=Agrococcus sp. Ld7 TaxID=649148 RepID=UPI00386F48A1